MDISTAVALERISSIVGYALKKGDFSTVSPNLPQRIAILGEANNANQATMSEDPQLLASAQQAGELYGFGSPIYHVMRILKPVNSDGVGGIPIVAYPQKEAGGATANVLTITVTGPATANTTHTVVVAGRKELDGQSYSFQVADGDTATDIATKIKNTINSVIGSPVEATSALGVVTVTTKWRSATASSLTLSVDNGGVGAGLTYVVAPGVTAGTGSPSIASALSKFGADWNTIVINTYGFDNTICAALEAFNGIPDPDTPTGRYTGVIMKPLIAITGSVLENPMSATTARKSQVTIACAPAPLSPAFQFEAAANMTYLFARVSQDTPHLDVQGMSYPDMPAPVSIGAFSSYDNRDIAVKNGCSTVELVAGRYRVVDFVTTYHPDGEIPPQFRYCRNLMLDFNVRFGYYLKEQLYVVGHALAGDMDTVEVSKVIKPKQWKAVVRDYANELASKGLIADAAFMQDSIQVQISPTNPDRLNTFFRYKRTGYLRIASTTAEAGFNFGTV